MKLGIYDMLEKFGLKNTSFDWKYEIELMIPSTPKILIIIIKLSFLSFFFFFFFFSPSHLLLD